VSEVSVGPLLDLPIDKGLCIDNGGTAVAVFRIGDGVHAIADRCSHAEASLSAGEVFGDEVECPKHGAAFDVTTGRALTLPASKPVEVFATDIRDGNVFVEIPDTENGDE